MSGTNGSIQSCGIEFRVVNGHIADPGKFEGCPRYAPFFHGLWMGGDGEPDDDTGTYLIALEPTDYTTFPELDGLKYVRVWETDQGFFYCEPATNNQ